MPTACTRGPPPNSSPACCCSKARLPFTLKANGIQPIVSWKYCSLSLIAATHSCSKSRVQTRGERWSAVPDCTCSCRSGQTYASPPEANGGKLSTKRENFSLVSIRNLAVGKHGSCNLVRRPNPSEGC